MFSEILALRNPLCEPVGGLGSNVLSSIDAYLSTAVLTALGVPTTLPLDATAATAVSAIIASATAKPNLGSPFDISNYPICAVSFPKTNMQDQPKSDVIRLANFCRGNWNEQLSLRS